MITYEPFWKYCKDNNITQYALKKNYNITNYQLDRLRNNKPISTETIDMLCTKLNLKVEQVLVHKD